MTVFLHGYVFFFMHSHIVLLRGPQAASCLYVSFLFAFVRHERSFLLKKPSLFFLIIVLFALVLFCFTHDALTGMEPATLTAFSLAASLGGAKAPVSFSLPAISLPRLAFSEALAYTEPKKEVPPEDTSDSQKNAPAMTEQETPVLPANILETRILQGKANFFGVEINNETTYDLSSAFCKEPLANVQGPRVLIVHTHTSEAYRPSSAYPYTPTDTDRTEDTNFSVARVGRALADALNEAGIETLHDETLCDYPSYNGAYSKAMELIESYTARYPSLQIILDLHRDAMQQSDGTKLSTIAEINGEKAAQVMLVVGTDAGGLTHPTWRKNFSFAVELQQRLNEQYPGLARPLNVRCERFNGHLSEHGLLIEVGTNGNTMDEALVSARALAGTLSTLLKDT